MLVRCLAVVPSLPCQTALTMYFRISTEPIPGCLGRPTHQTSMQHDEFTDLNITLGRRASAAYTDWRSAFTDMAASARFAQTSRRLQRAAQGEDTGCDTSRAQGCSTNSVHMPSTSTSTSTSTDRSAVTGERAI